MQKQKSVTFLFWVFVLFTASARAEIADFYNYLYRFENSVPVANGVFDVPAPRVADLERDRAQFSNYDQFLDYLFEKTPLLRSRFVLLHHSGSLQLASPEFPRVILFEGGVTYAFSEHPGNRKRAVEILEVSPTTYEVSAAEIRFTAKGVEIERNPKACLTCHGQPAKLLWDPYDFWPQAFGSAIGQILTKQEGDAYQKLYANASQSPLLRRLRLSEKISIGDEENTAFTQFVSQLNVPRFLHEQVLNKDLGGWRWPLLLALGSCQTGGFGDDMKKSREKWLTFFRPEEQASAQATYDRFFADILQARQRFKSLQDALIFEFFPNATKIYRMNHERLIQEAADMAMIRTVFEMTGIDASNLSTSHFGNDYLISTPSNILVDVNTMLAFEKPDWYQGTNSRGSEPGNQNTRWVLPDCAVLKEKSLEAKRDWTLSGVWRASTEDQPTRPVMSRCMKCHVEGLNAEAPPIPFHDSVKMAALLRDPNSDWKQKILDRIQRHDQKRMPLEPAQALSQKQIESLKAYLEALE